MFGTEHPSKSNKYHRGLYHMKTHGQRRQRCFSMKYSLVTMKPNTMRRTFYSQILGINLRLWVSMKARRTIMKRGSFDNYIMNTKQQHIDSKFGLYLRQLMKKKEKNPQMEVPYILGQAAIRTRRTRQWASKNDLSIYLPRMASLHEDMSKYYIKTPQEMSRYEIAELEQQIRKITEAEEEEEEDEAEIEAMKKDPEYHQFLQKLEQLCKLRHGVIKRYFEKNKYKRTNRNEIIQAAEESEEAIKAILGKRHVHFMDANPEIREFMAQVNKDQEVKEDDKVQKRGMKQGDLPDI